MNLLLVKFPFLYAQSDSQIFPALYMYSNPGTASWYGGVWRWEPVNLACVALWIAVNRKFRLLPMSGTGIEAVLARLRLSKLCGSWTCSTCYSCFCAAFSKRKGRFWAAIFWSDDRTHLRALAVLLTLQGVCVQLIKKAAYNHPLPKRKFVFVRGIQVGCVVLAAETLPRLPRF